MDEFSENQEHLFIGRRRALVICPANEEYASVIDRKCEFCGETV